MAERIKPYWLFIIPLALILPIVALGFFVLAQPPKPPFEFIEFGRTKGEYPAERAVLTPGDTLVYSPTLIVRQAGRIDVLRSFWSLTEDGDARLCNGELAKVDDFSRVRPAGIVGNIRGGRAVRQPVLNLPPGDYLFLASVSGPGRGQSGYAVRFSITQKCA